MVELALIFITNYKIFEIFNSNCGNTKQIEKNYQKEILRYDHDYDEEMHDNVTFSYGLTNNIENFKINNNNKNNNMDFNEKLKSDNLYMINLKNDHVQHSFSENKNNEFEELILDDDLIMDIYNTINAEETNFETKTKAEDYIIGDSKKIESLVSDKKQNLNFKIFNDSLKKERNIKMQSAYKESRIPLQRINLLNSNTKESALELNDDEMVNILNFYDTNCKTPIKTPLRTPIKFQKKTSDEDKENVNLLSSKRKRLNFMNSKKCEIKSKITKKIHFPLKKKEIKRNYKLLKSNIGDIIIDLDCSIDKNDINASEKISILTYNILSQLYMRKYDREDLSLHNRMSQIVEEVKSLFPDILCFQEADLDVLKNHLTVPLRDYTFIYGVNMGSTFINIIGYKKSKYKLISFKNFSLKQMNSAGNRGICNVILEQYSNKEQISIYNLHLPWRSEEHRTEMVQYVYQHLSETNYIKYAFIVGDFNTEPSSLPIKLIYYEDAFKDKYCMKKIQELTNINKLNLNLFQYMHNKYNLSSAYENYQNYFSKNSLNSKFKDHPEFTSCTKHFKDTIDYIFYSKLHTKLIKLLKVPERTELEAEGFLPSAKYPSDHVKLYSEFRLI